MDCRHTTEERGYVSTLRESLPYAEAGGHPALLSRSDVISTARAAALKEPCIGERG